MLEGRDRFFRVFNYTAYRKAKVCAALTGQRIRIEDFQETYALQLSRLPQFEQLSQEKFASKVQTAITERVEALVREHTANKRSFLGAAGVAAKSPFAFPSTSSTSPRPLCYTKCPEAKKAFLEEYFPWLSAYIVASRKFRAGDFFVLFPPFSIRPPLHYELSTA